ncbi:A.superbus venom factor 1-like [Diadema antillarum]|uniref:A.superbus venom factor 1-like n=2 Tax=Diadema antillarum TaxID=105358 RepID=UPI003A8BE559
MGCWQLGLALAAVAAMISGGAAEPIFFVTAPEVLRVGVDENVFLSMSGDVAQHVSMLVYLTLPNSDEKFIRTAVTIPNSGPRSVTTTIRIEPRHLPARVSQHHVKLGVTSQNPNYPFQDEQRVPVTFQSGFVFIQTDKPIYVPNSEVKTNVISLDQNMRPSTRTLHVEVKNPDGISVKRFMETEAGPNGFIQDLFEIPSRPMFGIWTIVASYGHKFQLTTNVTFEVREYVLPTFSVTVHPRTGYILQGTQSLEVDITASYVYGKPVNGRYLLKYGFVRRDGTVEMMTEMKRGQLQAGDATVTIDSLDTAFGEEWFEDFEDCRWHVEAIVEERTTGHTEAAIDTSTMVVSTPYKLSHKHTVQYFKKGLNVHVKIDVQYANGNIASEVPVQIVLEATLSDRSTQVLYDREQETDAKGRVAVVEDTPPNAVSISVLCQTTTAEFIGSQAVLRFELIPYEPSVGNEVVTIIISDLEPLQVDEIKQVNVYRSGSGNAQLHYMCVTAGKIVHSGTLQNVGATPVLQIPISQAMVPRTRIIVYYFTETATGVTYVTADSLLVEVEEQCGGEVTISSRVPPPLISEYLPHAPVNVRIEAPRESAVAIMAVDTAVYLLRDKDRLTRRKMFNRMKRYDVGCGPGGGRTASMVFENSGMTVLTNAQLELSVRDGPQCRQAPARRRRSVIAECFSTTIQQCMTDRPRLRTVLEGNTPDCTFLTQLLKRTCDSVTRDERVEFRLCCQSRTQTFVLRSSDDEDVGEVNANAEVRKDFRETWFFELLEMGDNAALTYQTSAPSSITTWEMAAVSVSGLLGMCVAPPSSVRVFQNFFIQLHLPYSVVRMEQMQVLATIFNYRNVQLQVDVNFTVPEGLCAGSGARGPIRRTLTVPPNDANTATFLVLPIEVGEHPIRVHAKARSSDAIDAVEKKLRVVAQGVRKRSVRSLTLDPSEILVNGEGGVTTQAPGNIDVNQRIINRRQISKMNVSLPHDSIMDTETCLVSMIANPLGTIAADPIRGLEGLIRVPTGCGEQTMIRLGPTLYVSKYLRVIGEETQEMERRAYDYIANGVNRELRYRQRSGAYAAFTHRPGSTWLTAFVVKVFSQARLFTRVDPEHVLGSVKWLIRENQIDDGSFEENHAVIHKEMIGAVTGPVSMTAFVLISLLETKTFLEPTTQAGDMAEIDQAISGAVRFLEGKIPEIERVYDKAIVAFALSLAGSATAEVANDRLKESARSVEDSSAVYWDPSAQNYNTGYVPFWLRRRPTSIAVETTAYALLAQLTRRDYHYAGRIVQWLSNQGNYKGGFVSTQDTVVAMQALAEYSSSRPMEDDIDLECTVGYPSRERITRYTFDNDNARVQQEEDVTPSIGQELTLVGAGQGIAKANVELSYNTEASDLDTCPFILNVTATEVREGANLKHIDIRVCTRYLGDEETHMAIIDVGIYSGFAPVIEELEEITNTSDLIASYEVNDRSVIFYADAIPHDELLCVSFKVLPQSTVGNIQAVPVHVYDYYNTDKTCTIFYKPGDGSPLLSTLCTADECVCVRDACFECGPQTQEQLQTAACVTDEHFAFKIRINTIAEKSGFKVIIATVTRPIKTGTDRLGAGQQREFYLSQHCTCVDLRRNGNYLIVGSKFVKYTTESGEEGYRYLIDAGSKFTRWPGRGPKASILNDFSRTMTLSGCEG